MTTLHTGQFTIGSVARCRDRIGSVVDLKDIRAGVRISLTKDQVCDLPPVELDIQE